MLREIIQLLKKDNLQAQALAECHEMLELCRIMIDASVESLRERDDASVDVDIPVLDRKINAFERDVRRKVMTHLSLGNTGDLAAGLVLISIVIDIERIGDYSKNIYDLAVNHPMRLHGGPLEGDLTKVEKSTLEVFRGAVLAFEKGDVDAARTLMREYKEDVSTLCRNMERSLVTGEIEMDSATATSLALYLRFLKRISAHSRNLASSVVNPLDRIGYSE